MGCLPRSRPLALATFMPSRVRSLIRSDSNPMIVERAIAVSRALLEQLPPAAALSAPRNR